MYFNKRILFVLSLHVIFFVTFFNEVYSIKRKYVKKSIRNALSADKHDNEMVFSDMSMFLSGPRGVSNPKSTAQIVLSNLPENLLNNTLVYLSQDTLKKLSSILPTNIKETNPIFVKIPGFNPNKEKSNEESAIKKKEEAGTIEKAEKKSEEEADKESEEEADKESEEEADKKSEEADKKSEEADKKSEETDKKSEETDKKSEETDKKSKKEAEKKSEETDKKSKKEAEKKSEETDKKSKKEAEKKSEKEADKKSEKEADKKDEKANKKTDEKLVEREREEENEEYKNIITELFNELPPDELGKFLQNLPDKDKRNMFPFISDDALDKLPETYANEIYSTPGIQKRTKPTDPPSTISNTTNTTSNSIKLISPLTTGVSTGFVSLLFLIAIIM